jgi:hypothetical protein
MHIQRRTDGKWKEQGSTEIKAIPGSNQSYQSSALQKDEKLRELLPKKFISI